ncbi:MAG: hypothetical protein H6767_03655 [Candidatus Peribacteria bacterium]|nr:MAG: hypothetical protein H6767_03655 [Candidatus Peribacteria bacterium]
MEKVIETKTCKHCSVSFSITDKDMEFYEKVSPIFSSSVIASETKQSNGERSPHSVRDDNTHIKNL